MIVHAGGAMTGMKSTVSADKKTIRYHIASIFAEFAGECQHFDSAVADHRYSKTMPFTGLALVFGWG